MRVHIKLSTTLRDCVPGYDPETGLRLDAPDGTTLAELATRAGLPISEIKITMVNGRQRKLDDMASDGDRVAFFPAVGGG